MEAHFFHEIRDKGQKTFAIQQLIWYDRSSKQAIFARHPERNNNLVRPEFSLKKNQQEGTKGQIISEWLFDVLKDVPNYQRKNLTDFESSLPHGFDKSADLLSKRQNHEEDFFKLLVLLKNSEL